MQGNIWKVIFGLVICLINSGTLFSQGKIVVTVKDLVEPGGVIRAGLFTSGQQLNLFNIPNAYRTVSVPADSSVVTFEFDSIPAGTYALSAYHDENCNNRMDYLAGEDYLFSSEKTPKIGLPPFEKAAFYFDGTYLHLYLHFENERLHDTLRLSRTAVTPIAGYTPETTVMLGINVVRLINFSKGDIASRTSYFDVYGILTFRRQYEVEQNYTIFSHNENYYFRGYTMYELFPQYYYGVGNYLPKSNKELITYRHLILDHMVLRKIHGKAFAGLGIRVDGVYGVRSPKHGIMQTERPPGYNGSFVSGIFAAFSYDTRDNIFNTYSGERHFIRYAIFRKWTASQYSFNFLELDLRKFIKTGAHNRVLALMAYGYFSSGSVPWNVMGIMGSDMIMRGYYSGRYRDKNYFAIQAEYRVPVTRIIGITAFTGFGEVAPRMSAFSFYGLKPNIGGGLRFKLDKKERLNLRLDYGIGYKTSNFYVQVSEAF